MKRRFCHPIHFSTYFHRLVEDMFLVGKKHFLLLVCSLNPGTFKETTLKLTSVYINRTRVKAKKKKITSKRQNKKVNKILRHTYTETKTILVKRANLILNLLSDVVLSFLNFLVSVHSKYLKIIQIFQFTNFYRPTFRRCLYKNLTIHVSNAQD